MDSDLRYLLECAEEITQCLQFKINLEPLEIHCESEFALIPYGELQGFYNILKKYKAKLEGAPQK